MSRFSRLYGLPALLLAFLLALSGIATAGGPRVQGSEEDQPESFDAKESPEEVEQYWTPERLREAKPMPVEVEWEPEPHDDAPPPDGPEESIDPERPIDDAAAQAVDPLGLTTTTAEVAPFAYPWPFTRTEVAPPYHQWPHSTHGRVFFTHGQWGSNHSCSATVVNAPNRSTVWTAGHCVHSGGWGGAWHRNWVFIPAYRDGTAPYGMWAARRLWTLVGWAIFNNIRYDLGAVELWPRWWGSRVQNFTGGQGLRVNAPRYTRYVSFGYPAGWPFNGQRMIRCVAMWGTNDAPWPGPGPLTMGKGCDVTGGASGGGWLTSWGPGGGYLQSVHSYKYWSQPLAVYGPYHGIGAWNLYWAAAL